MISTNSDLFEHGKKGFEKENVTDINQARLRNIYDNHTRRFKKMLKEKANLILLPRHNFFEYGQDWM